MDAHDAQKDNQACQVVNKSIKGPIVSFTNTGAQPHAMVVKLKHAIIAHIAVTGPWRSKYVTGLTEFELKSHRVIHLRNLRVKNLPFFADCLILFGYIVAPGAPRKNSRVHGRRSDA